MQPIGPVRAIAEDADQAAQDGLAICFSGGGYRAQVFHLGVLLRLNEAALLTKIARYSSVSGGSVTNAYLGLKWASLSFQDGVATNLETEVIAPLQKLAGRTIDESAVLIGIFTPDTISDQIIKAFNKHLFKGATLQDLPDSPRFVFNATSVQSGALCRFSKPYLADYRVGKISNPTITLAESVAASAAFPPVLSPVRIDVEDELFEDLPGTELHRRPFTSELVLTDGGVYDNLGLETIWKNYRSILVSDAGGRLQAEGEPKSDWAQHTYRVLNLIDNQVRSLRKRQLLDSFELMKTEPESRLARNGAYIGIRSDISKFGLPNSLPCPYEQTLKLAELPTRFQRLEDTTQDALINWGYAVCDASLRRHYDARISLPVGFPRPGGVG